MLMRGLGSGGGVVRGVVDIQGGGGGGNAKERVSRGWHLCRHQV